MRPARALLATVLIAAAAPASLHGDHARPGAPEAAPDRPPFAIDAPVGLRFDSPAGLVILTARINERDEVRLLLDTGDPGGLTLDLRAARAIGLPLDAGVAMRATGVVGDRAGLLRHARVESLRLGPLVARDLVAAVASGVPGVPLPAGRGADGVIGLALLRRYRVLLEYPARRITVSPGGTAPSLLPDARPRPLRLDGDRVAAEIVLNGSERRWMILDTAATGTLISMADAPLARPAPEAGMRSITDASGQAVTLPARLLPSVDLGGVTLRGVPVIPYDFGSADPALLAGAPGEIAGIVGADVLSRLVLELDFPGRSLRSAPGASP